MGEVNVVELISLSIPIVQGLSKEEIALRIEQEEVCNLAIKDLIKGELSLNDVLDIFEFCEVDIDEYLNSSISNFEKLGVL